jgi:hypothetical protein
MNVCSSFGDAFMHRPFLSVAIGAFLSSSMAFAQTSTATAASGVPSASVSAVCKDGTSYSGATLKGACRGHGGIDKKASKTSAAPSGSAASTTAATAAASTVTPAAGGGFGKVWVNNPTKVYHCPNDRYYGKTKNGAYMSEADAKAKGFRPDHGKACQ